MITTFSAIRMPFVKIAIIGLALLLLGGCSSLKLAYGQAPTLAWWWLDRYGDFDDDQTVLVKDGIDQWFAWHRATQLPEYVALLATAQTQVLDPVTPEQLCRWNDELRARVPPMIERALPLLADLVPKLTPANLKHIEHRYQKSNEEFRDEHIEGKREDRLKKATRKAIDRAELMYGKLDEAQKRLIAQGVVDSPVDPQAWYGDRLWRQEEVLRTLRRFAGPAGTGPGRADLIAALRVLTDRPLRSGQPEYRERQKRVAEYRCQWFAQIHNSTTPVQRQAAKTRLKGWEDDLRSFIAAPARAAMVESAR